MKIDNAHISMKSARIYSVKDETSTLIRAWIDPQPEERTDKVSISQTAINSQKACQCNNENELADPTLDVEVSLKMLIAEILSGRKVNILRIEDYRGNQTNPEDMPQQSTANTNEAQNNHKGWGLEIKSEDIHKEKEDVSFSAHGTVKTSDGKEYSFSLQLDMNREFVEKNNLTIRAGDALTDPLIINFNGNAAQLSNFRFSFDLDGDGKEEQMSALGPGSGFLAIDINKNGDIDSGKELFGPDTGDGFRELAKYDSDKNAWIDENDEAFKYLGVLTFDENGDRYYHSLASKNIGAIYTPSSSTQFDIREELNNALLGRVMNSGIYLDEQGQAGTVQQVDFVT